MAPPAADSSMMTGVSRSQSSYTTKGSSAAPACRASGTTTKSGNTGAGTESGSNAASAAATGTGTGKKSNTPEFLLKLYRILQQEDSDIISWDNGRIHVRNPSVLGHEILHKYFRHSKYSSFQRQLNYFGFRKTQGKGKMSACTYTNIQLHGGSLKSLLGCKRKTSSVPRAGSDDEEREERDDLMSDDESDSGPVLTQPLSKRQRSMSAASAAESVSTSPDSILDNMSVKSDDDSSDSLSFTNSPPRPVAQPKRSVCIVVPPTGGAGNAEGTVCMAAPSATLLPVTGAVSTPRGAIGAMEHFFDKDYMSLGSALPSPRGADDLFRCGTGLFIDDDEVENAWMQPPVQGSLGSLGEPQAFELDYGNDLAWSDTDSSDTAPESNKDAFWYLFDGNNNHVSMA